MPDDFLTTAQAAEILGVSKRRVQSLITSGLLPAQKHGRDYLIRAADVAALPRRTAGRPRATRRA